MRPANRPPGTRCSECKDQFFCERCVADVACCVCTQNSGDTDRAEHAKIIRQQIAARDYYKRKIKEHLESALQKRAKNGHD